jgi:hypothetical protein
MAGMKCISGLHLIYIQLLGNYRKALITSGHPV